MRKLKQIEMIPRTTNKHGVPHGSSQEVMALDDNGELWHGSLETTDDGRRVIDWTPVNTPKDGAGFSEPQMDRFDKWEREANERLQADADASGETVPLATEEQTDAKATGESVQDSSDDDLEDGEVADPSE